MEQKQKRQYIKKEFKLSHIEKWRQSSLSMSAYSRDANLPLSSLSKWVRSETNSKNTFKPISISSSISTNQNNLIEIIIDQRLKVRLLNVTDTAIIINLIKGLMQCN